MKEIARFHKHIDNGGVTIWVTYTDDEYKQLLVNFGANYFDYPGVSSTLHGLSSLGSQDLQEIGLMFLNAASKYKEVEKEIADN